MPLEFDDDLNPRSILPMTDTEIEQIYRAVRASERQMAASASKPSEATYIDAAIWTVLLLAWMIDRDMGMLPLLCGILLIAIFGWIATSNGIPIGLFSALNRRSTPRAKGQMVDVNDIGVLRTVVMHISNEPIQYGRQIQSQIQSDRQAIAASLADLDRIRSALKDELDLADEEAMKVLIQSRMEASDQAIAKLHDLDLQLANQLRESSDAVKPVTDMLARFERLSSLSTNLAKIQSAHGLIEQTESSISEHRQALQALKGAASLAVDRLQEISGIVKAHERARAEVMDI